MTMHTSSATPQPAVPLLDMQSIRKTFGKTQAGLLERSLARVGLHRLPSPVQAIDHVDLQIYPGEAVGLVGESGCGKSTLGRIAAGFLKPDSGTVLIDGKSRDHASADQKLQIQMIFQDAHSSLNPRQRIDQAVGEGALLHALTTTADYDQYVSHQLERAGLDPAMRFRYPHQFSGGQRQRIGIARALAVQPRMLVCDESVASLDVSIQAQILNLLMRLRQELNLTWLFISHDLSVIRHMSDRVLVMYLGRVVESAPVHELFARPNHPYTQALLAHIPRLDARRTRFAPIQGEIPNPASPPPGCHFAPRCPRAMPRCHQEAPQLRGIAIRHLSACHLNDQA